MKLATCVVALLLLLTSTGCKPAGPSAQAEDVRRKAIALEVSMKDIVLFTFKSSGDRLQKWRDMQVAVREFEVAFEVNKMRLTSEQWLHSREALLAARALIEQSGIKVDSPQFKEKDVKYRDAMNRAIAALSK